MSDSKAQEAPEVIITPADGSEEETLAELPRAVSHESRQQPQTASEGAVSDKLQFDSPNDPDNPVNWSNRYKVSIAFLISLMSLVANMGILLSAPFAPIILKQFGDDSKLEAVLLVSIWELGEVISPLFLGPLSELLGRRPVYNCANICFVIVSCGAALSDNTSMLIAFRFLCGLAIASTTLNSCIVGDMYRQDQRGRAISWLGMMPFIGPVLGPVVGGYVSQSIGWRWTFWLTAIAMGVLEIVFLFTFRECYAPRILLVRSRQRRQQHKGWRHWGRTRPHALGSLSKSLYRPFKMLFTQPAIILVTLNWLLASAYLHLLFNTMNFVYQDMYHFAPGPVGLAYLGFGLGMIASVLVCSQTLDRFLKRQKRIRGAYRAADRLPPVIVGNVLLCVGMLWFGWAVEGHTAWIVPILASSLLGASFVATSIGIQSYLVDMFGIHAASALAAAIALRNTAATVFPLVGPALWARLGYGMGGTMLALLSIAFLPIPVMLFLKGECSLLFSSKS